MPDLSQLATFSLVAFGLALTPGPNAIYLVSRAISQGRRAGLISLGGVAVGYVFYMLCAAFGITALLLAVPFAYGTLRIVGAAYLLVLAWQILRPGGRSPFQARKLPDESPRRLFTMGLLTNLLNPKIAIIYLSLLPQFIVPDHGSVLVQSLALGAVQTAFGVVVNAMFVVAAGSLARFMARRPAWSAAQRWLTGSVLAALAVRLATSAQN